MSTWLLRLEMFFRQISAIALVTTLAPSVVAVPKTAVDDYKAAVKLENSGKVEAALAAFRALPEGAKDFDVRLHIGSCLRKLGRLKEAEATYAAISSDPIADLATRETADSELGDLRPRLATIRITAVASSPCLRATIDGKVVTLPAIATVDPGSHEVLATCNGTALISREVTLAERGTIDIEIPTPSEPSAPVPAHSSAAALDTHSDQGGSLRAAGWISMGVGVAALGAGTVFLLRTDSLRDEGNDLAARGDPAAFDRIESARSAQLIARIGFALGVVGVAAGSVIVLTSRSTAGGVTTSLRVGPSWLALEGAW